MATITIYCCGTDFNPGSGDLIANLHDWTTSLKHILVGPGGGKKGTQFHNKGAARVAPQKMGSAFGWGVDPAVRDAIGFIKKYAGDSRRGESTVVNLCGWSRGAVACFKIAHQLDRLNIRDRTKVEVNIFAIDPVPGGGMIAGFGNGEMWNRLGLPTHLAYRCRVILAQHERRALFNPVLHFKHCGKEWKTKPGNDPNYSVDLMPGVHSTVVQVDPPKLLVGVQAMRFLKSNGTKFGNDASGWPDPDRDDGKRAILNHYSDIIFDWGRYQELASADAAGRTRFDSSDSRDVRGRKWFLVPHKRKMELVNQALGPGQFVNKHQIETLSELGYPVMAAKFRGEPVADEAARADRSRFLDAEGGYPFFHNFL